MHHKLKNMISILIPTYNHSALSLVKELSSQGLDVGIPFEIIVLDDCSTNKTILEENRQINYIKNCYFKESNTNNGRTFTRNILANNAKFNWLLFLDADVIPKNNSLLKNYAHEILSNSFDVVIGGCAYEDEKPKENKILRYLYGKKREEKAADLRNKFPHKHIFSGNILIKKDVFLKYNYPLQHNIYGLDNYFAFQLFLNKINVKHIDNSVYHLGLEENEVFFKKSINSIQSRIEILKDEPQIEQFDTVLKHYMFFKKTKLNTIVSFFFRLSEPFLRRRILSAKPSIFAFDLYRLGYICNLNI